MASVSARHIPRKPVGSETAVIMRDFVPLSEYQCKMVEAARKRVHDHDRNVNLSVRIQRDLTPRGFHFSEAQIVDAFDAMIDSCERAVAVAHSAFRFGLEESARMLRDAFREREVA